MKVSVYDTYVPKKDGTVMHFDILVPETLKDEARIHNFGKEFIASKNESGQPLTSQECRFCHIEQATEPVLEDIRTKGYHIIEMQGC